MSYARLQLYRKNGSFSSRSRIVLKPVLAKLLHLLPGPVSHDAEVAPSSPVSLASFAVLSRLDCCVLISAARLSSRQTSGYAIVGPGLHRDVARGAFGGAIQHILAAFLTAGEGDRDFLCRHAVSIISKVLNLHLCIMIPAFPPGWRPFPLPRFQPLPRPRCSITSELETAAYANKYSCEARRLAFLRPHPY